ncbi:MAG: ArnT family glycosyltransferase [Chroococcales cyanobacterium]
MQNLALNRRWLKAILPYLTLLLLYIPLLIIHTDGQSLMAHDEGLYATRAKLMFQSGDWINPWSTPHHKTPGPYWLVAASYSLFGISEASARLPSLIASILSILLVYEIGKIILNKPVGWLAAAILNLGFLWFQYSRLTNPDVSFICLVLLGIWALLKAEKEPQYDNIFRFISGISFGFGFLMRSFMVVLPILACLPYLIGENRRHRHLVKVELYLGLLIGLLPTLAWGIACWLRYGQETWGALFGFVINLGSEERHGNGLFYYLWHLPILTFPWSLLSLLGLSVAFYKPIPRYHLLLTGFPIVFLIELSLFSTRLPHYSLSIYPFIALLAALGLYCLFNRPLEKVKAQRQWLSWLSYLLGGIGILILIASFILIFELSVPWVILDEEIKQYGAIAFPLGLFWSNLLILYVAKYHFKKQFSISRYWIGSLLLGAWFSLAIASHIGLLGNYNPQIKAFIQQPEVANVLQNHSVNFVKENSNKTYVLLRFYTPTINEKVSHISELSPLSYTWIETDNLAEISLPYQEFGAIQGWHLIQLLPPNS